MKLTPKQDATAVAAAYLGGLAACMALICAIVDTGYQTQSMHARCLEVSSRSYCDLTYFGR